MQHRAQLANRFGTVGRGYLAPTTAVDQKIGHLVSPKTSVKRDLLVKSPDGNFALGGKYRLGDDGKFVGRGSPSDSPSRREINPPTKPFRFARPVKASTGRSPGELGANRDAERNDAGNLSRLLLPPLGLPVGCGDVERLAPALVTVVWSGATPHLCGQRTRLLRLIGGDDSAGRNERTPENSGNAATRVD